MKPVIYAVLFLIFLVVIYQLNSLFNVNEEMMRKYSTSAMREKLEKNELVKEIQEQGKRIKTETNDLVESVDTKLEEMDYREMVKFSKEYFSQVGRNYRVYYIKNENMTYVHRMWFDQIRNPWEVIKGDFPSIFEQSGCCFVGEQDFFIVIPGTPMFKEIGHYKFDR